MVTRSLLMMMVVSSIGCIAPANPVEGGSGDNLYVATVLTDP